MNYAFRCCSLQYFHSSRVWPDKSDNLLLLIYLLKAAALLPVTFDFYGFPHGLRSTFYVTQELNIPSWDHTKDFLMEIIFFSLTEPWEIKTTVHSPFIKEITLAENFKSNFYYYQCNEFDSGTEVKSVALLNYTLQLAGSITFIGPEYLCSKKLNFPLLPQLPMTFVLIRL